MNFIFNLFNFMGVVALAFLCSVQWKTNSHLVRENTEYQNEIHQQAKIIADQAGTLKENESDLNDFRHRLTLAETQLKSDELKLAHLTSERDQLKALDDRLLAAVAARDAVLKQQTDSIHQLANARNDAISKFNDLVAKYNALMKQ